MSSGCADLLPMYATIPHMSVVLVSGSESALFPIDLRPPGAEARPRVVRRLGPPGSDDWNRGPGFPQ